MRRFLMAVVGAGMVGLAAAAGAQEAATKVQTRCPIMGGKIDRSLFVEKDGLRIYVCCPGCLAGLEKDFAKHAAKLAQAGVTVEKAQTACLVDAGRPIDRKVFAEHDGKRVYACCVECLPALNKSFGEYVKKLEAAGITPAPAQPDPKKD